MERSSTYDARECGCARCDQAHRGRDCAIERLANRVALDLHDGVAQTLSLALLNSEHFECGQCTESAASSMACWSESVSRALSQIRMIIEDLRPGALAESTLAERLNTAVETFMAQTEIVVTLNMNPNDLHDLGRATEITAFRVLQESLNNIRRHSQASHVLIEVQIGRASCRERV